MTNLNVLLIVPSLVAGTMWASTQSSIGINSAQTRERLLEKGPFRNEPMRIVGTKAKGKTNEPGKKFVEEDDWLNTLHLKLKNISVKPIIFFEVSLSFPAVADDPYGPEPGYVRDIKYGREPLLEASALPDQVKPVMPNEIVDLTLTAEDQQAIESALIGLNYPPSTYVKMLLRTVIFDDDTMWRAGEILRRDPDEPGTWRVIPRAQVQHHNESTATW